jgi:hypothetical protein
MCVEKKACRQVKPNFATGECGKGTLSEAVEVAMGNQIYIIHLNFFNKFHLPFSYIFQTAYLPGNKKANYLKRKR